MNGWRVVLAGGETFALATDTETWRSDPRTWYRASQGLHGSGSYEGYHAAVMALASMKNWAVREVVPPGELTTAETIAAERKRVADVLAEVERELKKRAEASSILAKCYGATREDDTRPLNDIVDTQISAARTSGRSAAYEHAAEIVRAEFATIGAGRD